MELFTSLVKINFCLGQHLLCSILTPSMPTKWCHSASYTSIFHSVFSLYLSIYILNIWQISNRIPYHTWWACPSYVYRVYTIRKKYIYEKSGLYIFVSLTCTVKNSSLNRSNGETLCKIYLILRCISLTVFPSVNRHSQNSEYLLCLKFWLWSIITNRLNY